VIDLNHGMNDLKLVREFEAVLDVELANRPSLAFRGEDCIAMAGQIINRGYSTPDTVSIAEAFTGT
jgi:hypothetical protein